MAHKTQTKPDALKGMSVTEKREYAAKRYTKRAMKRADKKAKKDSFGFTIQRGKKEGPGPMRKIREQGI